ncbi:MAG TPA: AMP-binding protein, partial [Actinophytocola sp.]|nr:AMP-binding protein [Actinophytocola sp.]
MEDATHEWPPVLVPTDRPRRPGAAVTCSGVVRTEPAGPPDVLLAGFAAVLHRYTGLDRVGLELGGARLRFRIGDGSTLPDLTAAGETVAGAGSGLVGARVATPAEPAGGEPLELRLVVRPDVVELWYDPRLFDRATVVRLLGHHRTLVEDGLAVPGRAVARLRMLTEAETRRILVGWNRTHADLPHGTCLHHAFESRVDSSPDATAVLHAGERWTYRRVNAEANRVAHHLRSLGVGPDVRVGLCLDRSPGMLVSVLGVLKAGGVYVPLDPDYPTKRLATMVEGTSCAVMISRTDLAANLPAAGAPLVLLDRDAAALAASPDHDPGPTAGPENLCYVI